MVELKLYHWNSMQSLESWRAGNLIVIARDLEEARKLAFDQFLEYVRNDESAPCNWMVGSYRDFPHDLDKDDKEEYDELVKTFFEDLQEIPDIGSIAIFIRGSS